MSLHRGSSSVCSVLVQNVNTGVTSNQNVWKLGNGTFAAVAGYDLATGWGSPK